MSAPGGGASLGSASGRRCTNEHFTLLAADEIPELEISWLIGNLLPRTGLACIYGPSGAGKSFLALDLAAAVAGGLPWFGHPTNRCPVVTVVLEGRAGFSRRVAAWVRSRDSEFPEGVRFVLDPFSLRGREHATSLGALINTCGGAGLVIIDTLNKASPGSDENSSSDMGKLIDGASALQEMTDGLVLLIHHPGKDVSRGLRGHSSLHAALDTVIQVERDGEALRWTLVKS